MTELEKYKSRLKSEIIELTRRLNVVSGDSHVIAKDNLALQIDGTLRANTLSPATVSSSEAAQALAEASGFDIEKLDVVDLATYFTRVLKSKRALLEAA